MTYDPSSPADRRALAVSLNAMLVNAGFVKQEVEYTEDVYEREVPQVPGARIVVFSSISRGEARELGADAIRVIVLFRRKDGSDRPLIKEGRVFRTGTIDKITARTLERMRDAFSDLRTRERSGFRCKHCSAPLFVSRNGKDVCAETCWAKDQS